MEGSLSFSEMQRMLKELEQKHDDLRKEYDGDWRLLHEKVSKLEASESTLVEETLYCHERLSALEVLVGPEKIQKCIAEKPDEVNSRMLEMQQILTDRINRRIDECT